MDLTSARTSATALRRALAAPRRGVDREGAQAYLFLSPGLLILVVFVVVPAVWVLVLSFYRWDLIGAEPAFIGLGNYRRMAIDPLWWKSLLQTCYFVAVSVPVGILLSLGLALLLNARLPGRSILRGAIFSPFVTPAVATIVIWEWIFNHDYGLLNGVLAVFHLPKIAWLTSPSWIMPSVILYSLWASVGFNMVIFLS